MEAGTGGFVMSMPKLIAGVLSNPLLLAFILAGVGLLLLRGSRRRTGAWIIAGSAALAYLASTSLIGNALLLPLERQYPAFESTQAVGVHDIVVLGSGYVPHDRIPVTGALDADGLARIVEGVRLARSRPDSRLLVSGGAPPGSMPSALGYARMAAELGIDRSALIVMDRALDTAQEAREVFALLGPSPFILVSSAYHLPRAMRLMRRAGANPVPAPTGQMLRAQSTNERIGLIPSSRGLRETEAALHEYLGLAAVNWGIE
jgi:uncharacterized SAM-binding protein YcdF (DUF218 family)